MNLTVGFFLLSLIFAAAEASRQGGWSSSMVDSSDESSDDIVVSQYEKNTNINAVRNIEPAVIVLPTATSLVTQPISENNKPALLYVPFDVDFNDHSPNHFSAQIFGNVQLDHVNFARGGGSLRVTPPDNYVSYPGTAGLDLKSSATFCSFFNPDVTLTSGAIISNQNPADTQMFTLSTGVVTNSSGTFVTGCLHFTQPIDISNCHSFPISPTGWTQACVTYDGQTANTYVNGAPVDVLPFPNGVLAISDWPYMIGFDTTFGDFHGNLDEELILPLAMTASQISAYYNGARWQSLVQ